MFNGLYLYKICCVLAKSFNAYIYSNGGSFTFYIFMIFNMGNMWSETAPRNEQHLAYQTPLITYTANETIKIKITL